VEDQDPAEPGATVVPDAPPEPKRRSLGDRIEQLFTFSVILYILLRAIPLWQPLSSGGVNPAIFLFLDVTTAWPYAKGLALLGRSVAGRRYERVPTALMMISGSLIPPYLYVAWTGQDLPKWVWGLMAIFFSITVATGIRSVRKAVRSREHTEGEEENNDERSMSQWTAFERTSKARAEEDPQRPCNTDEGRLVAGPPDSPDHPKERDHRRPRGDIRHPLHSRKPTRR